MEACFQSGTYGSGRGRRERSDRSPPIDTYRPEIVERAYEIIGPFIVNDVGGGTPDMLRTVGELGLPYIAMHGRKPQGDVIEDILGFFRDFAVRAEANGINDWILDPGFGFGKDIDQNYEVLNRLDELKKAGRDILVGISRKSMIYKKLGITPEEAMPETLALERIALEKLFSVRALYSASISLISSLRRAISFSWLLTSIVALTQLRTLLWDRNRRTTATTVVTIITNGMK